METFFVLQISDLSENQLKEFIDLQVAKVYKFISKNSKLKVKTNSETLNNRQRVLRENSQNHSQEYVTESRITQIIHESLQVAAKDL